MAFDNSRFLVYCHAGEVAYVLIGARQLVEERSLSAVLITQERESHFLVNDMFVFALAPLQRVHFAIARVSLLMPVAGAEVVPAL